MSCVPGANASKNVVSEMWDGPCQNSRTDVEEQGVSAPGQSVPDVWAHRIMTTVRIHPQDDWCSRQLQGDAAKTTSGEGVQTPMVQGRSTKIISIIEWIRTSRLSMKYSLSSRRLQEAAVQTTSGERLSLGGGGGPRVGDGDGREAGRGASAEGIRRRMTSVRSHPQDDYRGSSLIRKSPPL